MSGSEDDGLWMMELYRGPFGEVPPPLAEEWEPDEPRLRGDASMVTNRHVPPDEGA